MKHLDACPICEHNKLHPYLSAKDYTVSHETFSLVECVQCGFVFTNPQPHEAKLGEYYQSEDYISHSDKSRTITDRIYRIARAFTLRWKLRLIHRYSLGTPKSLLDYGCGTGAFLKACKDKGLTINGIEPDSGARSIATHETEVPIAPSLQAVQGTYHAITLWHVLEHVSDLHSTLTQLSDLLAKNGTMFIAVPNLKSYDATKYREHWAAYDVPRHLWHFSQTTMTRALNTHKLQVAHVIPMRLDAYYVSLLSEKYLHGRQTVGSMVRALFAGFNSNHKAKQTGEYSSLIFVARK
jgi:2-polyprenyl-3-methyl-5-hydroxy-6-metoxy-1,4-benzoquinol methylase